MKTYWVLEVQLHTFFDLGTSWRCVVSITSRLPYSRETALGTYWIGGWMGHRAGNYRGEKFPASDRLTRSQSLYRLSYNLLFHLTIFLQLNVFKKFE
jgi:hypothetical protein